MLGIYVAAVIYSKVKKRPARARVVSDNTHSDLVTASVHNRSMSARSMSQAYSIPNRLKRLTTVELLNLDPEAKKKLNEKPTFWSKTKRFCIEVVSSPYFALQFCRLGLLYWCLRYNCFQGIPLIIWLFYSTVYNKGSTFIRVTEIVFFPYFLYYLLQFYALNIPFIVPDKFLKDKAYEKYGIYLFQHSFMQLFALILVLFCFCIVFKLSRTKIVLPKEPPKKGKQKDLPSFFEVFGAFLLMNLDKLILVMMYFLAVTRVDVYHLGLMIFFICFMLYPEWSRRHFVLLLLYLQFFVVAQ